MLVLQVLAVAAVAPFSPQTQGAVESTAPGDGLLHIEVPDIPGLLEAYPDAPLLQMIQDEAVRSAVAELLGAADLEVGAAVGRALQRAGVPDGLTASPIQALVGMLEQLRSLSFSLSLTGRTEEVARNLAAALEAHSRIQVLSAKAQAFKEANQGFPPGSVDDLELPEEWQKDPWGNPYTFEVDIDSLAFEVVSLGADGAAGGVGFAADLSSAKPVERTASDLVASTLDLVTRVEFTGQESAHAAWDLLTGALESELGARPGGRRELVVRGGRARVCELPDVPGSALAPWLFAVEDEISLGLGRDSLGRTLARAQTEAGKLHSSASVQRVAEHLSESKGATVASGWVELDRLDMLLSSIERGLEAAGDSNVNFMRLSGSGLFRMQLDNDRFVTEYAYNVSSDSALARCAGAAPVPEALWSFIPSEAIGVYASSIDGRAIYDEIMRSITEVHGERPKALERLEREHGFSLENDLIGNLGGGAAAYLLPISGVVTIPGVAVVVELRDAAAFQRGLDAVLKVLQEQAGGEFSVRYKPYRDQPMWSFQFGGDSGGFTGPIAISPTLTIVGNHLMVSLTSTRAKKEVKRLLDGEAQERHRLFTARGAPPEDAGTITFMDWPTLANGTYEGARAALTMFGGMLGELPVDPQELPPADTFTRFFEPSVSWTRAVAPDVRLTHSESSFGPETWLGLAGGVGALVLAAQDLRSAAVAVEQLEVDVTPESGQQPDDAETSEAVQESHAAMEWLATRLEVYRIESGSYPRALSVLSQPTKSYPKGFLDGGGMPNDGWGRELRYEAAPDGKSFRLWSAGPDGRDESGAGDDLSMR
jgi:hypothetical protein